jgi:uncharacterized protein YecT (DUF1311 family)
VPYLSRTLIGAVAALLVSHQAFPAGLPQGSKIRVQLSVASRLESDRSLITSYLSRCLRQIQDVVVVGDNPLVTLSVVAFRTSNVGGYQTGYAISIAVTSCFRARLISKHYIAQLPADEQAEFRDELSSLAQCQDHLLYTCAPNELKSMCGDIVDHVDGSDFEDIRLLAQKLVDAGVLTENSELSRSQTPTDQQSTDKKSLGPLDNGAEYKAAEAELSRVYSELRSHLTERAKLALKKEEIDWLAKREKLRDDPAAFIAETKARVRELSNRIHY